MAESYACWKCGGALPDILLPLPRAEECPHCRAQLHVCRMCVFFDPNAPQQCRETVADLVTDKQRANFCGYFQINAQAFNGEKDQGADARRQLDALFGDAPESGADAQGLPEGLEDLFKK